MPEELAPGPSRPGFLAALIGAVALIPSVLLVTFGVLGIPMPGIISHPVIVLGGLAFAILINVGSSIRCRVQADGEGISVEGEIRLRYRKLNLVILLAGGAIAAIIFMYLIGENFGPR